MMDFILFLPMEIRLLMLFFLGYAIAVFIPRFTARYSTKTPREKAEKPGSLLLPRLFRVGVGISLAGLYGWEIAVQGISLSGKITDLPFRLETESLETLHLRFLVHAIFFVFLLAATYIDFEEMIIPDSITIPGTILGIVFAAWIPQSLLPATQFVDLETLKEISGIENLRDIREIGPVYDTKTVPLHLVSSQIWPQSLDPAPQKESLFLAVGIWWFWCVAMMNRIWYFQLPLKKSCGIFVRHLLRSRSTVCWIAAGIAGSLLIFLFWNHAEERSVHWSGFLSSLVGLFAGAVLIWSVRLIGYFALNREAMGFGDVILMGMIGTFVGWQCCVLIFFLAPIAGLFLGIARMILGLGRELPYGPFLCLGTVFLILFWPYWWNTAEPFFTSGWLVPGIMFFCMVLLGVMLKIWNLISRRLQGTRR